MTYEEAVKYIRDTAAFGSKLGLDNIRTLMSLLGNPQEKLNIIHIAGTNGKGSVASYILSVLDMAGYRVGFYTSPELVRFSERIRINYEEISENDIAVYTGRVYHAAKYMEEHELGRPSEFELVLAMAFCYFLECRVSLVILEVGLGGRLDATNVINHSLLSVITRISYDHMQYLGDTLPLIAAEKAAIIKPRGRVMTYRADAGIMNVIKETCREKDAELYISEPAVRIKASLAEGQVFTLSGKTYRTRMAGLYEVENAALAIQAIRLIAGQGKGRLRVSEKDMELGIERAGWPGRFEILSSEPLVIADGAHNEDGARALSETLTEYFGEQKLILCIGILKDKQYKKMLELLIPHAKKVIVCEVPNPRTLTMPELEKAIREVSREVGIMIPDPGSDVTECIKKLQPEAAATVICGSLYLVGPMRERFIRSKQ
ncbi:MAG: bifunctional folylpolyglutamate synthase/dihydrofolate synthase [Lachnospiraceae bacterium]|nr:bifunctional folylpolyglutamate synthase/dihydrofolate synthase [Lachnospiraceae bacterium]